MIFTAMYVCGFAEVPGLNEYQASRDIIIALDLAKADQLMQEVGRWAGGVGTGPL